MFEMKYFPLLSRRLRRRGDGQPQVLGGVLLPLRDAPSKLLPGRTGGRAQGELPTVGKEGDIKLV